MIEIADPGRIHSKRKAITALFSYAARLCRSETGNTEFLIFFSALRGPRVSGDSCGVALDHMSPRCLRSVPSLWSGQ